MTHEKFELDEQAAIVAYFDRMSDDEFVANLNSAPDMGGALMVELGNFVAVRDENHAMA